MVVFTGNLLSAVFVILGFFYVPLVAPWWLAVLAVSIGILFFLIAAGLEREIRVDKLQYMVRTGILLDDENKVGRKVA